MESNEIPFSVIRDGDREAFERLFRTHFEELLRFIWGYVGSEAVAEEIIQELFLRLWEDHREVKITGSLKSYLFTSARNMSIDYNRHQQVRQSWAREKKALHNPGHAPAIDEHLHNKLLLKEIKQAIREFPERRREIFMLSRYERMSYKEIADFLDLSVSTVETQMSRALKALRNKFGIYLSVGALLLL